MAATASPARTASPRSPRATACGRPCSPGSAVNRGKADYAQRSRTIEPVFGQVKTIQGGGRFMRRGLRACRAEWKLLCGTHNLLKLWRTTTATTS